MDCTSAQDTEARGVGGSEPKETEKLQADVGKLKPVAFGLKLNYVESVG